MPKKIAVIDCETDPFKQGRIPQPFIWGYYTPDEGFLSFPDTESLFEHLAGMDMRIYAHNGGKFDFHYMLDKIPSWSKVITINGRLAQFRIDKLEFCDSYCILPVPLSAYQKTDIDYNIFEPDQRDKPENKQKIFDYLRDDCVFTYELIDAFIKEHGNHLTIPSAAIKKLQKMEDIKIPDSGRKFFEAIRPFYYGGRVECFKKGLVKGNLQYYDINSAYPYAMLHKHPIGDYFTENKSKPSIVGHNFYSFSAKSLGAFPYRQDDGRLFFPADNKTRIFNCTGWELIAAQKHGKAQNIKHIEQKVFLETKDFKKYVNYFYSIKVNSKKGSPDNIFSKLFLNSAYGKFAANPEKYKTTYLCEIDDFDSAIGQGYTIHGEIHDRLLISKPMDDEKWRHYNVATGASITGFVRAYLFEAIQNVEKPLYCDTDSLIFTGKNSLELSDKLGAWKKEGEFTTGGIGGKKIYAFKNEKTGDIKCACKGAILDYDEIIEVCKGGTVEKTPDAPIFSLKRGKYFLKKSIAMT